MSEEEATLNSREVAAILGVSNSTLWRWGPEKLPYVEITAGGGERRGKRRYRPSDVNALKEAMTAEKAQPKDRRSEKDRWRELDLWRAEVDRERAQVTSEVTSIRAWLERHDREALRRDDQTGADDA